MRHGSTIVTLGLAVAAAVLVFELKSTVRDVERELASVQRQLEEGHWRLQKLRADHAFLTRPERLAMQAEQLGLVPGTAREMALVETIAYDGQLLFADKVVPVDLADGRQLQLRFKPVKPGWASGRPMREAVSAKLDRLH